MNEIPSWSCAWTLDTGEWWSLSVQHCSAAAWIATAEVMPGTTLKRFAWASVMAYYFLKLNIKTWKWSGRYIFLLTYDFLLNRIRAAVQVKEFEEFNSALKMLAYAQTRRVGIGFMPYPQSHVQLQFPTQPTTLLHERTRKIAKSPFWNNDSLLQNIGNEYIGKFIWK